MKQNWEYKKLGDVCDIICGQDYKAVLDDNGPYPIYGTGGVMGYASQYRCPANSIIIGRKGSINNPLFVEEPFWNVDTAFGMVPNPHFLTPKYFFYFCRNYDFTQHDVAVTIPSLRRIDLVKIQVPIPPLSEQSRIVAELDLLTGIIDKQNAQLKELDNLAQAIFYDMFGDPIENPKRWNILSFVDVCSSLFAGGDVPKDRLSNQRSSEFPIPILSNGIGEKALYGFTDKARVLEECITISGRGTIGYCEVRKEPFFPVVRLIVAVPNQKIILPILLKYIVDGLHFHGNGGAIPQLTIPMIKDTRIYLPPLALQQSFADKIQSIENQKAKIKASIAETQKLLNYTMDKYFG